ncbi:hypothetical protein [Novosphingobium terrae]|uniref:hypothetical protein n=1 Tax=Novosphingobium terrae TaxID=2726189 RepID=UPI0019824E09|nr:hypothetical protein [Novosphingobium terrae]
MMPKHALASALALPLLTASSLALLAPGQAWAAGDQCRLTALNLSGINASYDPFDPAAVISPAPISVRTSGDCTGAHLQLSLVASQTSPETGASARLVLGGNAILANVTIAGHAAPVVQPSQAFVPNPVSLPLGSAGSLLGNANMAMSVPEGQVARPGVYSASLQIAAQLTDRSNHKSELTVPVILSLSVIPSMRLVGGGNSRLIDLGELAENKVSSTFPFTAYANDDYAIVVSSQNGFQIKRRNSPNSPGVRYSPVLANAALSSVDGHGTMRAQFPPPIGGIQHHAVSIRVGTINGMMAGDYSDVMTLQIQPKI